MRSLLIFRVLKPRRITSARHFQRKSTRVLHTRKTQQQKREPPDWVLGSRVPVYFALCAKSETCLARLNASICFAKRQGFTRCGSLAASADYGCSSFSRVARKANLCSAATPPFASKTARFHPLRVSCEPRAVACNRGPLQQKGTPPQPWGCSFLLERITGLEPATSTLARSRSTK